VSAQTRRAFIGGVGTVAAAVAVALTPGLRAVALQATAPGVPPALAAVADGNWHVDDICGHMPRYAHPIPYMHDTTAPDYSALVAPVDRQFVA
jgi:hypothetical protein